jgi:hypothetical protein
MVYLVSCVYIDDTLNSEHRVERSLATGRRLLLKTALKYDLLVHGVNPTGSMSQSELMFGLMKIYLEQVSRCILLKFMMIR